MAKGSDSSLGEFPKVCSACGGPINFTRCPEPLWFETVGRVKRSYHLYCHPLCLVKPTGNVK